MSSAIVFVSNPYLPDPRVKKEIATLRKAGHKVMLVARNTEPRLKKNQRLEHCNIHRITLPIPRKVNYLNGGLYYLRYVWRSYKYAKRKKFDIIHCHDLYTLPIGVLLRAKRKKPLIYDSHEFYPGLHYPDGGLAHRAMDLVERMMLRSTDSVITVSQKLAERYEKYDPKVLLNCPEKQNMPDYDRAAIRKEYGVSEDAFVLVYQGILSDSRNLESIVTELAQKASEIIPGSIVLVCGTGPMEKILRKKAGKNVIFTGHIEQKKLLALLASSDAGLLLFEKTPNNILGLPNKLFEYMMVGLPSIVSDLPVMAKIVRDQNVGIVVDPENLEQITGAVKELANDSEKTAIMGKNGQEAIESEYNWESQSGVLIELYKNILKR